MASAASNEFGWNLFSLLSKDRGKDNLFLSPFSLSIALAMTRIGAEGQTALGMEKALCWKADGDVIHKEFQQYIKVLHRLRSACTVKTASRMYLQDGYPILESCLQQTKKFYLAEPVSAQFARDAQGEITNINNWVEEQTANKIKDLIPPGLIAADTVMVLVNAIYFKGNWKQQFLTRFVESKPFYITQAKVTPVPMMKLNHKFRYHKAHDYALLELPYKGDRFSMVILLPEERDGLKDLEERLTITKIQESISKLVLGKKINLLLPKFEICTDFQLKDPLIELGMGDAFSLCAANFSGVTGNQELHLYEAMHKAYLKVDEKGSEAAAATGCSAVRHSAVIEKLMPFHVDHPFLVLIRDKRNDMILFFGHITNPSLLSS